MTRDPRDTLVVTGGRGPTSIDTTAIRAASARISTAADTLRGAVGDCLSARTALERLLWAPPLAVTDPALPGRLRWALELADDAVGRLGERATGCTSGSDRLLVAAGLYEDTATFVEKTVEAVVTGASGVIAYGVTSRVLSSPVALAALWAGAQARDAWHDDAPADGGLGRAADGAVAHDASAARTTGTAEAPDGAGDPADPGDDGGLLGDLLRTVAPYVDEAIDGAGTGIALAAPTLSHGETSATGGARVLSALHELLLPGRVVDLRSIPPTELGDREPAWSSTPPGRVPELVARLADLYPHGNGIPGRDVPGVPHGTVAVQQVEHAEGPDSWVVTVPGTQALVSAEHAFDVDTDLDLMADDPRDVADVVTGVLQALDDAGAAPGEPVVLAGHSLGGIAVTAITSDPVFRARHTLGGVVTVGAPTGPFGTPRGAPVLHVENTEELVSPLDGRSSDENPATADRVTLSRTLADSDDPADRAASGSVSQAHEVATHVRTLALAQEVGNVQVADVSARIEQHLDGESARTTYYVVGRSRTADG